MPSSAPRFQKDSATRFSSRWRRRRRPSGRPSAAFRTSFTKARPGSSARRRILRALRRRLSASARLIPPPASASSRTRIGARPRPTTGTRSPHRCARSSRTSFMIAVVLNGDTKSALASVRSLGARGIAVICGAEKRSAMALHSKYVSKRFIYRSPLANPDGFLEDVIRACEPSAEPPVLFVFSDAAYLALARNRARWEGKARMPLPSAENVERAFDKEATITLAESLGIPVPFTGGITADTDFDNVFWECRTIPIVVKPRHSASWKGKKGA